jgi:hypothetical protein
MIIPFLILKLNMKTFLNPHLHLNRFIQPRFILDQLDNHVFILFNRGEEFAIDEDADEVADGDVAAVIGFVGFFIGSEVEGDGGLGLEEGAGGLELFGEGDEVVVRSAVVYCV